MKQKDKLYSKIYFIGMVALLSLGGLLWVLLPERSFSQMENRYLTVWPKVSLKEVRSGEVQKNMTSAADDQFVQRDLFMRAATGIQKLLGMKDINGVYIGKNGTYFEKVLDSDLPEKRYQNNLKYVEKLAGETKAEVAVLLAPSAGIILPENLPAHAVLYNADKRYAEGKELLEKAQWIDIRQKLKIEKVENKESQLYFKTDHHWTTQGAYQAYFAYMGAKKENALAYQSFKPRKISNSFYGTLFSKAPGGIRPDPLLIPQRIKPCKIVCDGKERDGIYDWAKLRVKDQYAIYFGGNYGLVSIENQEWGEQKEKTLVVIKDSYANSMVPYLIPHYSKIIMLDFRYYNESVSQLLKKEKPSEILVLYEMSNFCKDTNLYKLIRSM